MTVVEQIAHIYVNYAEPAGRVFLLFMAVMAVIYVVSFVKDPAKQIDMASHFFQWIVNMMVQSVVWTGMAIYETFRFIFRIFHIIFATLRDFFISRI